MLVFISNRGLLEEHDRVIVTPCSDPHWVGAVDDFFEHGLNIKTPARLGMPGGPGAALHTPQHWAQIQLLMERGCIKSIAVAHQECGWYKNRYPGMNEERLYRLQLADLFSYKEKILHQLPGGVLLYYAKVLPGGKIKFSPVE